MEIIERVKNILITPKNEWEVINNDNEPNMKVLMSYLLFLALIPAIGQFIGQGLVGYSVGSGIRVGGIIVLGIKQAIISFVTMIGGAYLTAFVINMLATSFNSEKNFDKAFALVAYAYTPMCIAGVFYILPSLYFVAMLAGIYSLYILYVGMKPIMKVPDEKNVGYFIVSLLSFIAVYAILVIMLAAIMTPFFIAKGVIGL